MRGWLELMGGGVVVLLALAIANAQGVASASLGLLWPAGWAIGYALILAGAAGIVWEPFASLRRRRQIATNREARAKAAQEHQRVMYSVRVILGNFRREGEDLIEKLRGLPDADLTNPASRTEWVNTTNNW